VRRSRILDKEHFGEGLALVPPLRGGGGEGGGGGGHLVQISYQHRRGFVYRTEDLAGPIREFEYDTVTGQGWGLAFDASHRELVVSDGSEYLFFWDADTLKEKRYVRVTLPITGDNDEPVYLKYINELEVLPGGRFALANVWYDDRIVQIELSSGVVVAVYDFRNLRPKRRRGEDCFNGIAFDEASGDLYVTGKLWANLYRIRLPDLSRFLS
jgi:glutamine cyclotransferase